MRTLPIPAGWAELQAHLEDWHDITDEVAVEPSREQRRIHDWLHRLRHAPGRPRAHRHGAMA